VAFRDIVEMTDPAVIRAMAHPARMAILAHLSDGPATATECSTVADQTPSSCSYHLRTLAELGFVQEVDSDDGRERRWRLTARRYGIPKRAQGSPEVRAAARLWGRQWVTIEQRILSEFLAAERREPAAWQQAATFYSFDVHLTADELLDLGERFAAMLEPYARAEPGDRPAGSRPVHVALTAFPRPDATDRRRRVAGPRQARERGS
jgi:DNA-binding transcriptional ArsR family regulator